MNDLSSAERPRPADELPSVTGTIERPHILLSSAAPSESGAGNRGSQILRRFAIGLIVFLWVTQYSTLTLMRFIRFPEEGTMSLVPRAMVALYGICFSLAILAVQRRARKLSLRSRVLMAFGLAGLGAILHSVVNYALFGLYFWSWDFEIGWYVAATIDWFWFYTATSIIILALTYGADLADNEEQIAALQARADASQLRALRYQLNPHFLFNTLNSIASLIARRKNVDAESMVVSLSDFLRSTLRIDPDVEIELGEEIALQSLYLDIERSRFPHRLHVTIDVPDHLRRALVPNLIMQPLVENAIKHGVAQSAKPVHVELIAREGLGTLQLEVRDDGGDASSGASGGASVGLRNVSERLALHFGSAASLHARAQAEGGFLARISMPLKKTG